MADLPDLFPLQTEQEIYEMFLEDLVAPSSGGVWNTREGSVIHAILQPLVLERLRLMSYVQDAVGSGFLKYAIGDSLDAKGIEFGLARGSAASSTVTLTVVGTAATNIPLGTSFSTLGDANTGDEGVEFETTEVVVIPGSGTVNVAARSSSTGIDTNVDSGTIISFVDIVAGLTSVTNVEPATGGADDQDDDAYRLSLISRATRLPSGGNKAFYQAIAYLLTTVGAASVDDLWLGAGTGRLVIGGEDTIWGEPEDVDSLQFRIDPSVKTLAHFESETWKGYAIQDASAIEGQYSQKMSPVTDTSHFMLLAKTLDLSYWSATTDSVAIYVRQDTANATIGNATVSFLGPTSPLDYYNNFSTDNLSTDFAFDEGSGTAAITGGLLTTSSTATKRLYWNGTNAAEHVNTITTNGKTIKHTTGTSIGSYETGHIIKRIDANNYIKVCVESATLRISKVVAGTPTSLASGAITALTTSTDYWLTVSIVGNDITAKHWTVAPTIAGVAATTVSHTLAGGDATQFGTGVKGYHGIFWIPNQTAATIDDYQIRPVIVGTTSTITGGTITAATGGLGGKARIAFNRSTFTDSGTFSWGSIGFIKVEQIATTSGTATTSWDSLRIRRASGGAGTGDAPIGTQMTVASVSRTLIQITAQVTPVAGVTLTDITPGLVTDIQEAIRDIQPDELLVRLSRIANAIHDHPGVLDYSNIQIGRVGGALSASNLTLVAGERPDATVVTISA